MWPPYRRRIEEDFLEPVGANARRLRTALEGVIERSRAGARA
jgi:hypothetical protein